MNQKNRQVSVLAKFFIGFSVFGGSLVAGIITGYISYFGTDVLGVSALALSNILLVSRIFDGVTDVLMGFVIDKTKSKYGKARPWIARAIIPFGVFSVLIFAVPGNFSTGAQLAWLFIFYNLYALASTAVTLAVDTLNLRLTRNPGEINSISTVLMFGMIFGNVAINAVAVAALTALSGGEVYTQSAFVRLTLILAVVSVAGGLATFFSVKELPDEADDGENVQSKESTLAGLKSLLQNKYWLLQVANTFFVYFGLNARLAVMIYYGIYVLKDPGLVAVLVLADNIPSLICMPIALKLNNVFGKRKVSLIGLCLTMAGFLIMFFNIYNLPLFIVGLIIRGICFSPVQGATNAFIADSALYGEWKTRIKAEGMAYSAVSFANKFSSGIAAVIVGWVLTLTGYVPNAAIQPDSAIHGLIFLYVGVTFICTIGQIVVFVFYNLDEKMDTIRTELLSRNGGK